MWPRLPRSSVFRSWWWRNTLGAINQTLQTLAVARMFAPRLPLGAVVLSTLDPEPHPSLTTNAREIRRRAADVPLLTLGFRAGDFSEPLDWFALAQPSVAPGLTTRPAPRLGKQSEPRSAR